MIWLTWKLLTLPIRLVFGGLRTVLRIVRFVGPGRIVAFGAGAATGLALAPTTGAEFRAQLREQRTAFSSTGGDLAASVRYELANSPRTWHLPQPEVEVVEDRVRLRGRVADGDARDALVRTAGSVIGVRAVDDLLDVGPGRDAGDSDGSGGR